MAVPKAHPSASLYVGDLLPTVTEANLFEIFTNIGHIASIRVCRDHLTKRSLGYAYVNYLQVTDAERALDTLNNSPIKGRPCRIMWCQRDPSVRKSGVGNIFIKNLDPLIGHKELFDTFSAFGNILSCKVAFDENGHSKGFGFVHFESQDSANRAIDEVNGKMINNRIVYVGKFESKKERHQQIESSWTNVYIKDISPDVSDTELRDIFVPFGHITSVVIMRKEDGTSKGFGFVNFDKHEEAVRSVEAVHQKPFGKEQKPLWCGRAQKRSERESELKNRFRIIKMERIKQYTGINLYIKNLDDNIKEEQLRKEFSVFGNIRSLKIMTDEKKNSKGFGFVCFDTPDEAQRAIAEMNNRPLSGTPKPLYVAFHEPKEIRRQKLAQEQLQRKQNPRSNLLQAVYPPPGYSYPPNPGPTQYIYPPQLVRQPPRNWPAYPPVPYPHNPSVRPPQRGPGGGVSRPKIPPVRHTNEPLSLEQLALFPPDQQKILLGEKLFVQIQKKIPDRAGKITGMILDAGWGLEELLSLLEHEEKLNQRIDEALGVLLKSTSEPML
jgi:polyadenylate-binding protein